MTSTAMTTITDTRPATRRPLLRRVGVDTGYLLLSFPLAIASFVVIVTGLSLGAGLLITLVGIPVLLATLYAARGFAAVERARLQWVTGAAMTPARYRTRSGSGLRRWFRGLADRQMWLDTLHGLVIFPIATFTWSVAVTWWSTALFGLSWPAFGHVLDRTNDKDSQDLPQLLGIDTYMHRSLFYVGIGLFALLTLPLVLRGLTALHVALGRGLLANSRVAALQARVEELTASRDATAQAEATSLRRLERDLHDGPQQRLTRIAMDLGMVQRKFETDPDAAKAMLGEALDQTRETIAEVRALSRGIAPPILVDRGLSAALAAVAARATVQVDLDVRLDDGERLPPAVENAAYFVVAEALTNVAKHADATECTVLVRRDNGAIRIEVSDNGRGGANVSKGHGLAGLDERVVGLGGTLTVTSPAGGPTELVAMVPCE
jgi:signal transduction histidine kinase